MKWKEKEAGKADESTSRYYDPDYRNHAMQLKALKSDFKDYLNSLLDPTFSPLKVIDFLNHYSCKTAEIEVKKEDQKAKGNENETVLPPLPIQKYHVDALYAMVEDLTSKTFCFSVPIPFGKML